MKLGPGWCQFLLPERSCFSQIGHIIFRALVALKTSVPFVCRFIACSSRIKVDRHTRTHTQTDRPSTVTLAAHARRGLINFYLSRLKLGYCAYGKFSHCAYQIKHVIVHTKTYSGYFWCCIGPAVAICIINNDSVKKGKHLYEF